MTMTAAQRKQAAKGLAKRMFKGKTADLDWDDLTAAIDSIDDMMDALPATLNAAQSIKTNFVQNLPEPFKSNTNAAEKALALKLWADQEVGDVDPI